MASEAGSVSLAAPVLGANLSDATPPSADISQPDLDAARTKSLKRSRPDSSRSPNPPSTTSAEPTSSPAAKSQKFAGKFSPQYVPVELTGVAAMEEERRRREEEQRNQAQPPPVSENPSHQAVASLMAGARAGMSKASDSPVAATAVMTEGVTSAPNAVSIPSPMQFDDKQDTSPASATSLASLGSSAPTGTASSTVMASPGGLPPAPDADVRDVRPEVAGQLPSPLDDPSSNRALSFPGNVLGQSDPARGPPSRGSSLPMPGQAIAPRSPSQKKHKCPYCETEFTRHHNLKSHLLTHSQEKPYVCQTCNMRFRRLHDLKRHMKLHTGERPHICPKCDRKFARGDALARHSKGQGGCAGRRASMGSFGGEDDYDGSNAGEGDEGPMDGVMYTNGGAQPEPEMSEEDRRRFSLPAINAQHVSPTHGPPDAYAAHHRGPSTYPPAGPRPPTSGGLYPPNANRGTMSSSGTSPSMTNSVPSGHGSTTSLSSLPLNTGSTSIYAQSGMTESPKPLSPAAMQAHQLGSDPSSIGRQRSPSLTAQFQQQHYGRRQSGRNSPPGMPLQSSHGPHSGPKLPALSGLAPPDSRYSLSSQGPGQQPAGDSHHGGAAGQQMPAPASPNSIYPPPSNVAPGRMGPQVPPHQGSGSGDSNSNNLFASGDRGVWAYVQSLEEKVKQLSDKVLAMENKEKMQEDKINRLSDELYNLRNQLNAQTQAQK